MPDRARVSIPDYGGFVKKNFSFFRLFFMGWPGKKQGKSVKKTGVFKAVCCTKWEKGRKMACRGNGQKKYFEKQAEKGAGP